MTQTTAQTDRPTKKARIEATTTKPRARFVEPIPPIKKPQKIQLTEGKEVASNPNPKNKGKAKETNPPDSESTEDEFPSNFKIVAGSYEKLLYGVEGTTTYSSDNKLEFHLKPIFAFPAHVSCIKAVAASPKGGKWLATGSADEIIKVWDLRRRKEIGGLMHHEGSITHLIFPSRSHLFSASEDGTLCLFRARDWAVLRALKGHKGRVNSIAAHPSGKVALSVGKDRTLRMWDLMRGKGVASTKLGKEGESVRWSSDGKLFVVQSGSSIDVYNTEMTLLHTFQHTSRIHDIMFCNDVLGEDEVLLVGAEDKKVAVYKLLDNPSQPPVIIAQMVGHGNRVKAIQTLKIALPPASDKLTATIVASVSSDGKIRVFDLGSIIVTSAAAVEIEASAEYDTKGTRLTCVTMADGDVPEHIMSNGKRKRDLNEQNSDEDEDAVLDEVASDSGGEEDDAEEEDEEEKEQED